MKSEFRVASMVGATVALLVACGSGDGDGSDPDPSMNTGGTVGASGGSSTAGQANPGSGGGGPSAMNGDPRQGGIGRPCDTDADCEDGQFCNQDNEDFIGHRQCTATCFDETDCEVFGELTMCIGANLCTARCLTDDDCPAQTRCSLNGWCDRTGAGSGNPYCTGSPTPCSVLDEFDCAGALGCRYDGRCSGVAPSCFSQLSSFLCTSVDGCYWSSSTESCSGVARSCSSISGEFSCTGQDGCSWSGSCTGAQIVDSCEDESAALCEFTPGCQLIVP